MRAVAKLKHLNSDRCKHTIVRNLSRILNIRILDINIENRTLYFVYDNMEAFDKAKRELHNIGYPILKCNYQLPRQRHILNEGVRAF